MGFRVASIPELPGDFNHDGTVDAADYVVWRKSDGTQAGYDTWRTHFGQTAGNGAALLSAHPLSATVPEPSVFVLLAVGLVCLTVGRSLSMLSATDR